MDSRNVSTTGGNQLTARLAAEVVAHSIRQRELAGYRRRPSPVYQILSGRDRKVLMCYEEG